MRAYVSSKESRSNENREARAGVSNRNVSIEYSWFLQKSIDLRNTDVAFDLPSQLTRYYYRKQLLV